MEQELDGLKHDTDETKRTKAHMALLQLRRKIEDYPHFVSIKENVDRALLPTGFNPNKRDNDMLATAIELASSNTDKIIIVSNDNEFLSNISDCINSNTISDYIEGINLDELLIRLGD